VRYISTRGEAPALGFVDVMLAGLASDGGLYVPEEWPRFSTDDWRRLRGKAYADVAFAVLKPFVGGEIPDSELKSMIAAAYSRFGHPAVAPLKQLDANLWLLELFHGPTLAFKDVAMQLLARMMDWALKRRGERATILGATSGDTGGAAIEAFKGSKRAPIFILHPHGRVSDVQRRQMTTVQSPSVHNIALEGTFDDCQAIVKALFNDRKFREATRLSGVNSINWARIAAQCVYYVTSALALGAPDRAIRYTVPTGNFGDIYAGYVAKRMGLPISSLRIATNVNDILARALKTGRYEVKSVVASSSPSMDIQVSSNFERLLFESHGRNADAVRRNMQSLAQSGAFAIDNEALRHIQDEFSAASCDESGTEDTIRSVLKATGELLDPHSAVGVRVSKNASETPEPTVALATAHPAKFPQAVEKYSGIRPALPFRIAGLMDAPERFNVLPNRVEAVRAYILERSPG
jgi:threonine synthase